ncbi:MAG TPA: glyoxalase/bleomycin resistance/extradiol dioxygenase family protein [Sphaerochaeta sp.]|nr:glyoxalase/bleomycin resistance/extradiol dioxygenase family protein [Sphaerochaeta sp.]
MGIASYVTGLQHIGIPTNNLDSTLAFYQSLGFEKQYGTNNKGEEVAFLLQKQVMIETYQNYQGAMAPGSIDHIALDVSDIEAVYAEVGKLGYPTLEDGIQGLPFWKHGVRFFTIEGPNKEKIEFSQML